MFTGRRLKDCKKNIEAESQENKAPSSLFTESEKTRRKPTFLLNSIGDGFLDPSRPHDGRIRVGIIRHSH